MTAAGRRASFYCNCITGIAVLALSACGGGSDPTSSADPPSSSSGSSTSSSSTSSSSSSSSGAATGTDVTTYHYDSMRTGGNLTETVLTPANVTSATFGLLRVMTTDAVVDAAPVIATGVTIGGSTYNVVYVGTENDSVYAFNADTGALLLHVSLLASGETPSDTRSCGQVEPAIGITATPVIDRSKGANGTVFVEAMSKDSSGGYHQRLHALDLTTLGERVAAVDIAATAAGSSSNGSGGVVTFSPGDYKERGALLAANGQIYTVWASHCDHAPYNGWIIAYNETTLAQSAVLNYTPNGTQGGIWNVGGLAADSTGVLYAMAGNGTFDTTMTGAGFPNQADYGNAVMKLTASATSLSVTDYWTASNTVSESAGDTDLGSGSPLVLPDQVDASGTARHLFIGAGKDGNVLLLDRDSLGKFNASTSTAYQRVTSLLPGGLYSAFTYFNGSVYTADINGTLKAFTLSAALLPASPSSQSTATFPYPGSSPSISANGTSNAILWALKSSTSAAAILHAFNPANLQQEYYNSTQAANNRDGFGNGEKYITPVVANGKVFVGTPTGVAVFGLL
jgi:hypothetical protein